MALISKSTKVSKILIPKNSDELRTYIFKKINKSWKIDVSDIDIRNVETLNKCFYGGKFIEITGLEYWDVSHIEDFSYMFAQNNELIEISDISKWNFSSAKNLMFMFYNTWKLETDINIKIPKSANCYFIKKNSKHPIGLIKY